MIVRNTRVILTALIVLLISGCKSTPSKTVVEYTPSTIPQQKPAPFTDVYELWQWVLARSEDGKIKSSHTRPGHVEIATAFARIGTPIGFTRSNDQLIAFAGATTQPLKEAHYSWQTLPGETQHMDHQARPPVAQSSNGDDDKSDVALIIFDLVDDMIDQALDNTGDDGRVNHESHRNRSPDKHHDAHRDDNSKSSHNAGEQKPPATQPTR